MSWGGGTQGLHENLTLSACTATTEGLYIQDPESFPENILSATTLNKLRTHILLEENFGGTFDGGISQFRFYTEPLSAPEVKHNFKLLKDTFSMFDPDCPVCTTVTCAPNDFTYTISDVTTTTTTIEPVTTTTTTISVSPTPTNTPTVTPTNTPTVTPTNTPTPTPSLPVESIIDPIITENDEYIIVANNEYLKY
jgi:hypothetical protein